MRILVPAIILLFACQSLQEAKDKVNESTYSGWWVYGEEYHIFKDEATLEEWNVIFPNEDTKELALLYLAVTGMEYFPLETNMTGILTNDTLIVSNFEITYIQGCGEE